MARRLALVTGASRGLGAAVAVELARAGWQLVLTARTQGGLEEVDDAIRALGHPGATLFPLDLNDGASLDALGPALFERFGGLDALVSCAAVLGKLTPAAHILPKDWSEVVGVNLAATWRLIRSCGPLLEAAPAGRAVFVTDSVASEPRAYWGAYGATKAGAAYLAETWRAELAEDARLRITLFDPGPMRTRLRAAAMPGEERETVPTPESVAPRIAALLAD